mgnify:CR=1 FL=1
MEQPSVNLSEPGAGCPAADGDRMVEATEARTLAAKHTPVERIATGWILGDWCGSPISYANVMILRENPLGPSATARRTGDATWTH